jgi:hypothetical protein
MINLCDDCKLAKWNSESMDNATCAEKPETKVIAEGNYVIECSSYCSKNVIKCFIAFMRKK